MGLFDIFGGSDKQSQSTYIDPQQAGALRNLWGSAGRQLERTSPFDATGKGFADSAYFSNVGRGMLGNLANANFGQSAVSPYQGGSSSLSGFMGSGFAGQQIQSLQDTLNRNLELGMNSIQSRFGQSGTMGSRAGVTAGTALGDTQLALGQGTSSILQGDLLRRQQAAQGMDAYSLGTGGLNLQSRQSMDRFGLGAGALMNQSNLGGLGSLQGMFDLGQAGFQSAWNPLLNYAAVLGRPTVIGEGSGSGTGGIFGSIGLNANLG